MHPFGPIAERHAAHKAVTERFMAELARDLEGCTTEPGCLNPIHHSTCPSHPGMVGRTT